jgi:hypothetical protein
MFIEGEKGVVRRQSLEEVFGFIISFQMEYAPI